MSEQGKAALMTWAFNVATADNRLPSSTNYLLRFLSDVLDVRFDAFASQQSKNVPAPGDPSSLEWWQAFEEAAGTGGKKKSAPKKRGGMSESEALEILKLQPGADESEIAAAFRKLASIHHPDRHAHLEEEQQKNAAKEFAKIRLAFEALQS